MKACLYPDEPWRGVPLGDHGLLWNRPWEADLQGDAIVTRFRRFAEQEVLPDLRRAAPEAEIETKALAQVPPLTPEPDSAAEALIRRLTGANRAETVCFATEGGLFQEAGFSTVICGPGSIPRSTQFCRSMGRATISLRTSNGSM